MNVHEIIFHVCIPQILNYLQGEYYAAGHFDYKEGIRKIVQRKQDLVT